MNGAAKTVHVLLTLPLSKGTVVSFACTVVAAPTCARTVSRASVINSCFTMFFILVTPALVAPLGQVGGSVARYSPSPTVVPEHMDQLLAWLEHGRRDVFLSKVKDKESFRPVVVRRYPLTLIFENERTAVPFVGLPIESAGRNVVKISRFFNCGNTAFASSGCDRMR